MAPLSEDLRQRIIAVWKRKRLTTAEIAERFGVGAATVTRLIRRYRDTKSVMPKPHGGGQPRRISEAQEPLLVELLLKHPDWTEAEYARYLRDEHGIRASAV